MSSFLPTYEERYKPYMGSRCESFGYMLKYMEDKTPFDPEFGFRIIETGCTRNPSIRIAMEGDGASSVIWDDFLKYHKGHLYSVDINEVFVNTCRGLVSPEHSTITCSDSVKHLMNLSVTEKWKADLIYLDSYDIDWNNPIPSALHHIKELIAVRPLIAPGTLIVVDDHRHPIGKGMLIYDFFEHLGIKPVFLGYQVGWIWPELPLSS